jgi:hypothetical protein
MAASVKRRSARPARFTRIGISSPRLLPQL